MSRHPKLLTTLAVPRPWRTAFKRDPVDFGMYSIVADWIEEKHHSRYAPTWRAAAARCWRPLLIRDESEHKTYWRWLSIKNVVIPASRTPHVQHACPPRCVLPVAVFQALIQHQYQTNSVIWSVRDYPSMPEAMAALLCALRAVPDKQLLEWSRV